MSHKTLRSATLAWVLAAFASCSSMPALDAGTPDAGMPDAGQADAGRPDSGEPDSQERYTFAGCDDAGSSGCPRDLVFACALNTIRERYSSCQTAADCIAVSTTNCVDVLTVCPPAAVNDAGAFLAEANAEGEHYCRTGRCRGFGSCGLSFQQRLVDCVAGRCVAMRDDAGP